MLFMIKLSPPKLSTLRPRSGLVSAISASSLPLFVLFATVANANETLPIPESDGSVPFVTSHIDDYSPAECTGQVSYTTDAAEVTERIAALNQNFSQALESIVSEASLVTCAAVTGTLSDTTQNINYIHETKGVYKVITAIEPTTTNEEDYIYTFDVLGVRYIPFDSEQQLDMANSTMLPAIGGSCTTDDLAYPFEADCTFAIAGENNSALSVGKLHYYF